METGIYEHYKGNRYEVIDMVRHSETEELLVLYKTLYEPIGLWVRPYGMFFEKVIINGVETPRFKYLEDAHE